MSKGRLPPSSPPRFNYPSLPVSSLVASIASEESIAMRRPKLQDTTSPEPSELDDSTYDILSDVLISDDDAHTESLGPGSSMGDDERSEYSDGEDTEEEDSDGFVLQGQHRSTVPLDQSMSTSATFPESDQGQAE